MAEGSFLGNHPRFRSGLAALGLCIGGIVLGLISALVTPVAYEAVLPVSTFVGSLLGRYVVQPGFGLLAAGYILYRGNAARFVRIQNLSPEGVAWILSGVVLERISRELSELVFGATHHGGPAKWEVLLADPVLILPAFVIMFLLMAPAEEVLYRGIIHGRLREQFDVTSRIAISAVLFGLIHLVLSGGVASFVTTSLSGFALATAYERTDNLLVPIGMHGMFWLMVPL
jgi:hypothetical protein